MKDIPLTQNFIRTLHRTLLREDYTVYRSLPGGVQTSYVVHAGQYKTRPNSVITRYGYRFEYASPEGVYSGNGARPVIFPGVPVTILQ